MDRKIYKIKDLKNLDIKDVRELYEKFVNPAQSNAIKSFGFGQELADYAIGQWIYLKDGSKILDFSGGYGVLTHGHNHPRIIEARLNFQNQNKMEIHKNYLSQYTAALSSNIANLLPGDLNKVYLPNSGAEANEGAIKIAYKYHNGKKKYLLHTDISFHGKTLGAGSISSSPESNFKFPGLENIDNFKYGDLSSLKEKIEKYKNNIYAIIVEPFSASSMNFLSDEFLLNLRNICDKEDILLIFDEVFTGWAKTGELFYFLYHKNLIPDILTFSKSFGGGKASISGYVVRDKLFKKSYDSLQDFNLHSTTYNAFGEENVTALEAINIILEENYCDKAKKIEQKLKPELIKLKKKYPKIIKEIKGVGALQGIRLSTESLLSTQLTKYIPMVNLNNSRFIEKVCYASIINSLYTDSKILSAFSQNKEICLWISPPLVVEMSDIDYFIAALDKTLKKGLNRLAIELFNSKVFSLFT
tara:strand:+ start:123 stop:1538 length:1416 start_codon:yes stop_codon:yes gene_type:complete